MLEKCASGPSDFVSGRRYVVFEPEELAAGWDGAKLCNAGGDMV
jgi:hypothetical protein